MKLIRHLFWAVFFCGVIGTTIGAAADSRPISTDSRIKTFVYSENDVFRVIVHHGYQTSIEFAQGEEINMISIGNNYAWHLTPMGRRLFIKPLEENIITNMTVLTNMRAYHFEIQSKLLTYTIDEELAYVVRFYYPDEDEIMDAKLNASLPGDTKVRRVKDEQIERDFNFGYEVSTINDIAPTQVFDNGVNTFFRFDLPGNEVPDIFMKKIFGYKKLEMRQRGNFIVVDEIAEEFKVVSGEQEMFVYRKS